MKEYKENTEYPIGTIVSTEYGKAIIAKIPKFDCCNLKCIFCDTTLCSTSLCDPSERKDNKNIYFKPLKEEEMEEGTVKLSLEDARSLYCQGGNFKTIALSAYSEEKLTKKKLPTSWEEFCNNNPRKVGECWISNDSEIEVVEYKYNDTGRESEEDKNLLPNEETAEAVLALCQLIQLRNCYNDGWKPDWSTAVEFKYTIEYVKDTIIPSTSWNLSRILAFKSSKLRDKFFDNFKDLIEQAKELI